MSVQDKRRTPNTPDGAGNANVRSNDQGSPNPARADFNGVIFGVHVEAWRLGDPPDR